jgi:large subunit ribosomal protein L21
MHTYAVIRTGGKQYRVTENDTISIEKIEASVGDMVRFMEVLMVSTNEGVKIGTPTVEDATVTGEVVAQTRGPKIEGFTYKPKKHSSRRYGHRQYLTRVAIRSIQA